MSNRDGYDIFTTQGKYVLQSLQQGRGRIGEVVHHYTSLDELWVE